MNGTTLVFFCIVLIVIGFVFRNIPMILKSEMKSKTTRDKIEKEKALHARAAARIAEKENQEQLDDK